MKRGPLALSLIVAIGLVILTIGYLARSGVFYVTGAQYYEACWDKWTASKRAQPPTPANARQAALWQSCEPLANRGIALAGIIFTGKPEVLPCPSVSVMLGGPWYVLIQQMEKSGGPSFVDTISPAEWTLHRVATELWPRCSEERARRGLPEYD
jgi:hypothetical protein